MREAMPPLNPLHVFEITARLGSFTKAAQKLRVTQPAVSRQVQTLENYLGVRLFERDKQGIRLTAVGEQFHRQISPAFQIIASASANLTATRKIEPLNVRTYTTFASKWLIHRLPSFYVTYPNIKLNISNVVAPVDFEKDNVDLAIQFGDGQWRGAESELLFPSNTRTFSNSVAVGAGGLLCAIAADSPTSTTRNVATSARRTMRFMRHLQADGGSDHAEPNRAATEATNRDARTSSAHPTIDRSIQTTDLPDQIRQRHAAYSAAAT